MDVLCVGFGEANWCQAPIRSLLTFLGGYFLFLGDLRGAETTRSWLSSSSISGPRQGPRMSIPLNERRVWLKSVHLNWGVWWSLFVLAKSGNREVFLVGERVASNRSGQEVDDLGELFVAVSRQGDERIPFVILGRPSQRVGREGGRDGRVLASISVLRWRNYVAELVLRSLGKRFLGLGGPVQAVLWNRALGRQGRHGSISAYNDLGYASVPSS